MFGGFCTLVEAAALTAVYVLGVETLVHRELRFAGDLPRVLTRCMVMVGSVLVILGVAMGLTNYLVDAEIPMRAAAWVEATVHSRALFLLALNGFLLIVGCLMDIFSAIVVVVPLILPIAAVFGIDPLHLGVIFLANLELGYLTPPVGLNLFLASSRFGKPSVDGVRGDAAVPARAARGGAARHLRARDHGRRRRAVGEVAASWRIAPTTGRVPRCKIPATSSCSFAANGNYCLSAATA